MTARQQIIRLLPLVLLIVLVITGLRGTVSEPRWTGPLRADGVAIGIALEVIFGAALIAIQVRDAAARRAAMDQPYTGEIKEIEPAGALRFTLRYVLVACMIAIAVVLLSDLHLHFFVKPHSLPAVPHKNKTATPPAGAHGGGPSFHVPVGPILYGLLIAVLVAAVVVSVWWSSRLRRPATPLVIEDVDTEELKAAVAEGRAALQEIDDARAAIIACYVAMERSLAEGGTERAAAETPDELLARAVASGTIRGAAAGTLTALFYEARFSSHPMTSRDAARAALDEISAELAAQRRVPSAAGQPTARDVTKPGGGWV